MVGSGGRTGMGKGGANGIGGRGGRAPILLFISFPLATTPSFFASLSSLLSPSKHRLLTITRKIMKLREESDFAMAWFLQLW